MAAVHNSSTTNLIFAAFLAGSLTINPQYNAHVEPENSSISFPRAIIMHHYFSPNKFHHFPNGLETAKKKFRAAKSLIRAVIQS